mgnify:CR=1 FL=1
MVSESIVVEEAGHIVARVCVEYEILKKWGREEIETHLTLRRKTVNSQLKAFSRLAEVKLHKEPFEKTPTNKIKRDLYTEGSR